MQQSLRIGTDSLTVLPGHENFIAIKYNAAGKVSWARTAGSDSEDAGYSIATDKCGNVWFSGAPANYLIPGFPVSFNGHTLNKPTGSIDPVFLVEYDSSGHYLNSMALPCGGDDAVDILTDNSGNFYIAGDYFNTSMIFGHDTLPFPASIQEALFIAKYKYDTGCEPPRTGITGTNTGLTDINFYPNPASNECTISSLIPFIPGSRLLLYDITGRLIKTFNLTGNNVIISLNGLSNSIYECMISYGDNRIMIKKLVVLN